MIVKVNGEERSVPEGATIMELLADLTTLAGVAVARNREIVPRSELDSVKVQPGDQIEIVRATQGG